MFALPVLPSAGRRRVHLITLLFPSDYFDNKSVDESFDAEYKEAAKLPEFRLVLYNHDVFIEGEKIKLHPKIEPGTCLA